MGKRKHVPIPNIISFDKVGERTGERCISILHVFAKYLFYLYNPIKFVLYSPSFENLNEEGLICFVSALEVETGPMASSQATPAAPPMIDTQAALLALLTQKFTSATTSTE